MHYIRHLYPLYTNKKQSFIYFLVRVGIEENMNNNSNLVEAVIDAIQIWNRQDDIEESHMDNIDQRSVNRFVYTELLGGE